MFVEKILKLCKDINEIPVKLSESTEQMKLWIHQVFQ